MDFSSINWPAIGTSVMGVGGGIWAYIQGKGGRQTADAQTQAQISEYRADSTVSDAASKQIDQLLARVDALETKVTSLWDNLQHAKEDADKLRDRVRLLESVLKANNIEVPPETP